MNTDQIISDWKRGAFHPVYWLEGDEAYHIDKLTAFAEQHILPASEAEFNLSIFYGKDSKAEDVLNACRRFESYLDHPLKSTIFIVAHKDKKLDGRGKLAKSLKGKAVVITTKKMYDNELPEWAANMVREKGLEIQPKALYMLVDHIGNDLQRMENEIEKLTVNLKGKKQIGEDDIEQYVGISKEFNVFELQAALGNRDLPNTLKILNYFAANPKAGPIQLILPTLYSFFSKLYIAAASGSKDEYGIAAALGIKAFFAKQYTQAMQRYSFNDIEKALILLNHYNLKSLGVGQVDTEDSSLMKELAAKIILQS